MTSLRSAFYRARGGIVVMAVTYAVSIAVGIAMVHADNAAALRYRDAVVARAHASDPASRADDRGKHLLAAGIDFCRNLGLAAIPDTILGFTFVGPVGIGAYRGWVGGIVSVNRFHRSRFGEWRAATYYIVTMLLQVTGFVLASGCGLYLGWANIRRQGPFIGPSWFRIPRTAAIDVARIYVVITPIFAAGSLFEFLWS